MLGILALIFAQPICGLGLALIVGRFNRWSG